MDLNVSHPREAALCRAQPRLAMPPPPLPAPPGPSPSDPQNGPARAPAPSLLRLTPGGLTTSVARRVLGGGGAADTLPSERWNPRKETRYE